MALALRALAEELLTRHGLLVEVIATDIEGAARTATFAFKGLRWIDNRGQTQSASRPGNPTNLEFVQDDDLAKFKKKAELFEIVASLGSGSATLLSKNRLASFGVWLVQKFNDEAKSVARNELEKRKRSDLIYKAL